MSVNALLSTLERSVRQGYSLGYAAQTAFRRARPRIFKLGLLNLRDFTVKRQLGALRSKWDGLLYSQRPGIFAF